VQIVESVRVNGKPKQSIVQHVGIAQDDEQLSKLKDLGTELIQRIEADRYSKGLFPTQPEEIRKRAGRPKRVDLADVTPVEEVRLCDVVEESRRIEGPTEALGSLYDYLGFNKILETRHANEILRDLVIERIMEPASKRRTQRKIVESIGREYSLDAVYRVLDKLEHRLPQMKHAVLASTASLTNNKVNLLLFDVTTLYFESTEVDELRKYGFSKDQKTHCTQVVLALATNEDGLPIGYELFPGNTAEVNTLIKSIHSWSNQLFIKEITFVADRALCSRKNLESIQNAGARYVVAMPLKRTLKQIEAAEILSAHKKSQAESVSKAFWLHETTHEGKRVIVTYTEERARKDASDRAQIIEKLEKKLSGKCKSEKKLITNNGYLKYIEQKGEPGTYLLSEEKIADDEAWDGLHAIVTNDFDTPARELLETYRRQWVIEESFRIQKHHLATRPMYHFKPERIAAHVGLCFLAFALLRQALQRIHLTQGAMSPLELRDTLNRVQASILVHRDNGTRYRMPSKFSHSASKIYKALGVKRSLDTAIYQD
jgi:hypothetical protein